MRLPRSRRLLPSTVLLLVLAGTSCGRQEVPDAAPPDAGGPSPAPGDAREFRDAYATAGLPAESPPTLVVLSPDTDEEFWLGETATPVNLTFLVENWTWPAAGRSVTCSVDGGVFGNPPGQPDPGPTGPASHIFEDVPVGRHRLCCTLTENGIPLSNCEATGCIDVTVSRECEYLTDPVCGDGNPCSADACLYDASIDHRRCIYGEVLAQDCCLSDMDCGCGPAGWQICVDGACKDCEDSGDCDDGNPCTVDQCSGGACSFQWSTLPGGTCCTGTAADGAVCDDGLYCTADLCSGVDPVTGKGTCVHPDAGYPDCCDSHGDCSDGNPCTSNVCMAHECRQAPVLDPLCCNPAMGNQDCDTGNPCEIGTCIVSTNQCVFSDLPFPDQLDGGPHCCEVHPDCMPGGIWEEDGDNDGDPGPNLPNTLDFCQGGQCAHVTDENFCTCMAGQACDHPCVPDSNVCTTDACVSNQCMHHPVPGCCLTAADCKDSDLCTTESCVGNVCVFGQVPDCCNKHTDCEDGNPCNVDACISKKCHHASNPAFPDCCSSDLDCDDNRECT
ncbi:MAG: hypothetical protein FJ098_14855, partial [Deltaproteobacteria bacterium]|nr:hypothetical protein [Deltaproteobacteria bacterium]